MKLRVHNAFEAKALIRESNEGRGRALPSENVEVTNHDGNALGEARWKGVVKGHVFKPKATLKDEQGAGTAERDE